MMSESVWLIRHGQSLANAGIATQHPKTIELTDLGLEQARQVCDRVKFTPDTIVVSSFNRTLDTARPLLTKFQNLGLTVPVSEWPIHEFTYLSPVRCRGTTAAQRQVWAKQYWLRADPDWEDGDGAESFRSFMSRVDQFSSQLAQEKGFVLVFGHGMFFKAFVIGMQFGTLATAEAMTRFRTLESATPIHNAQILRLARSHAGAWRVIEDRCDDA